MKKTADGKQLVQIDLVSAPDDVNALWLNMKKEMETPHVEVHQKRDADSKKVSERHPFTPCFSRADPSPPLRPIPTPIFEPIPS